MFADTVRTKLDQIMHALRASDPGETALLRHRISRIEEAVNNLKVISKDPTSRFVAVEREGLKALQDAAGG